MAECSGMVTDITPATRQMKDIIDSLTDLGYEGPLSQEVHLQECITQGLESEEFIHFVTWLSNDISRLLKLEESVSTGLGPDDANVFKVEVKGFLSALQCPYCFLIKDLDALLTLEYRFALIEYLTSELQATKLIVLDQIEDKAKKVEHSATILAHDATISVLQGLQCSQPPAHVTFEMITTKILSKVFSSLPQLVVIRVLW
ncbi:Protein FAM98A-like [Oopsacas minuta]|uniref:Protein FAM98A-like n=1 Tax=Oopsacas minuta TaxID=111878 RepID=A0AAV7K6P3_9METZ|nr:Protein FAM98A-like [Oopsacas minuta]